MADVIPGWLVNDYLTCIEGTSTLWHKLLDWFPGLKWQGDCEFGELGYKVFRRYHQSGSGKDTPRPLYLIRNATYFEAMPMAVPTIALLQDIMPVGSEARRDQIEVCKEAALTIFNSAYTRSKYPELEDVPYRVIPLPVDFELFKPMPEVAKRFDICWVGAASSVKGWDVLCDVIRKSELTFRLILKDKASCISNARVEIVRKVAHSDLPRLINECRVGLCTSREETQHLAGIEMGGCGLPLMVTKVGAYWERAEGVWSIPHVPATSAEMKKEDGKRREQAPGIAAYWKAEFGEERCKEAWEEAIDYVLQTERSASGTT